MSGEAVPTAAASRSRLRRWWMLQVVSVGTGIAGGLGIGLQGAFVIWATVYRPTWVSLAVSGLVVVTMLTVVVMAATVVASLLLGREQGVVVRPPVRVRLKGTALALIIAGPALLGWGPLSLLGFPIWFGGAWILATLVHRALDRGDLATAARRWGWSALTVVQRGAGGRLVVERGDGDAVERTARGGVEDPAWGGRPAWLQEHVRALLERDPEAGLAAAENHVRARPAEAESHGLLALAQCMVGRTDDETVPRLELALDHARRLPQAVRHPHGVVILEATRAWAHAARGERALADEQLRHLVRPTAPVCAAEVAWRVGRARRALGDEVGAQAELRAHADGTDWAARRCRADLGAT